MEKDYVVYMYNKNYNKFAQIITILLVSKRSNACIYCMQKLMHLELTELFQYTFKPH